VIKEIQSCLEEMEQGHLQAVVVEWEEAKAEDREVREGWEEGSLWLDGRRIVYVPIAAQ